MNEITQADRELLAAAFRDADCPRNADYVSKGKSSRSMMVNVDIALRAIAAARRQGQAAHDARRPIAWIVQTRHCGECYQFSDEFVERFPGAPADLTPFTAPPSAPVGVDAHKATLASLVSAVSLLRRGGRKAAPSDVMFNMMLADYEKAIEASRAAIAQQPAAVDEAMARRLDDYLSGEYYVSIGKQGAHAALCHALAAQQGDHNG